MSPQREAGGGEVANLVDHLFRREAGRLVATLAGAFGPRHLDLAEEVVQEALLEALRRWPLSGAPDEPAGWLFRVARNRALDRLRRNATFARKQPEVASLLESRVQDLSEARFAGEILDDQLRLIFVCCHPDLPPDSRVALTLKVVCGFSAAEIAAGFVASETTVAQRLTRAKRRIADLALPYAVPPPSELPDRLEAVMKVLYLLFNEGHSPSAGDAVVRRDLCEEAVRLAEILCDHPVTGRPEAHALAALLLLHGARLPSRVDPAGGIVLLEDQDRSRWDRSWMSRGFSHLRAAMAAESLTTYHLEAGIAAHHAAAPSWEATDWQAIVRDYDRLVSVSPTPVRELNRAVAVSMLKGPETGLAEIRRISERHRLRGYSLLHAVRAELLRRSGRPSEALESLDSAIRLSRTRATRQLLEARRWPLANAT